MGKLTKRSDATGESRKAYVFMHDGWEFQVLELPSVGERGRAQLWTRVPGSRTWEIGHSKPIPPDRDLSWVGTRMEWLMRGTISRDVYNTMIPD